MPLEIIGAGLGRTGTLSLKVALEQLGLGPCYHMTEVFAHPEHVPVWEAAGRGEPVDWDGLFRGYRATVDWPGCNFYRELMGRYPDAKVVLTVRDPVRWYESARRTIYAARGAFPRRLCPFLPRIGRMMGMVDRLVWDGFFLGRFEDEEYALAAFDRHAEEVRRTVPPERLLVYEVREGWGPLCAFLGVPVPVGVPFPHVNDTEEFRSRIGKMARIARAVGYAALGLAVSLVAGLAIWLLR